MIIYSQKYYIKYNQIVKHYKDLDLKKSKNLYTESHHIMPKSMGGDDSKENLVRVPARVHFLLHWMLYKIYRTKEMIYAWNCMCRGDAKNNNRYTSHSFMYARVLLSINGPMTGKYHSEETKSKMRASSKGKNLGKIPWNKGTSVSIEVKRQMSISRKGRSVWNKGIPHSVDTREKISLAYKSAPELICPYCNTIGKANMKRYHFDNCKKKEISL